MKMPRIRVLPLTIVFGALLFAVQIGSLWTTATVMIAGPAQAKESENPAAASKLVEQGADGAAVARDVAGDHAAADKPAEADAHASPADHASASGRTAKPEEPDNFTLEELEVLYDLVKRREILEKREQALSAREALVDAAEQRMADKVGEMQELRTSIEALVKKYDAQARKELDGVVRIYEAMKPQDAARILEKLELPILLSIVEAMKERKTSAILANMIPDRAREVTTEMARKKDLKLDSVRDVGSPG
jgi:flagellar motility protein MotE (MotC chaperone)